MDLIKFENNVLVLDQKTSQKIANFEKTIKDMKKQEKALKGLHLREDVRKYVDIPINEEMAIELLQRYLNGK